MSEKMLKKICLFVLDVLSVSAKFYTCILIILLLTIEGIYWYNHEKKDERVVVAVIDTGVKMNHPLLRNHIIHPFDMLGKDFIPEDKDGHGTFLSGIIHQQAPDAWIMPVKNLGTKDETKQEHAFDTSVSVMYSILRGADVVNMSFVTYNDSFLTKWAIKYGQWKGVIFVAATGNEGKNKLHQPADINGVIQVAGVTKKNEFYKDSNLGSKTKFAALGVDVKGINAHPTKEEGAYTLKTGTSVSTAYVSGIIAYLKSQHPTWKQERIEKELRTYSDRVNDVGSRELHPLYGINVDKIKAHEQKQLYFQTHLETKTTAKERINIGLDSVHASQYEVNVEGKYQSYPSSQKKANVFLHEGYNHIKLTAFGHQESIVKEIVVLKDSEKPLLTYLGVYDDEAIVLVQDYRMKKIKISGKYTKYHYMKLTDNENSEEKTEYVISIKNKNQPFDLMVEDGAGNKSSYSYLKE